MQSPTPRLSVENTQRPLGRPSLVTACDRVDDVGAKPCGLIRGMAVAHGHQPGLTETEEVAQTKSAGGSHRGWRSET